MSCSSVSPSELCPLTAPFILRLVSDERTGPLLTVAVVARMLGIAPATLRTWDRRYGLGPSVHVPGAHRKYAPADVARLEAVHRLVLAGVTPAEAARAAVGAPARVDAGRHGGRVLPLPGADEVVRGLGRAAMALDADAVLSCLSAQLRERGTVEAWDHVLVPVLVAVGARWEATGEGVEVEHLLADCITTALKTHAGVARSNQRPMLLACAPGDLHALPLHALAAALAEDGHGSRILGASVPAVALAAAITRTGAAAVFLWAQLAKPGHASLLDSLPVTRPATAVVVGGPGWPTELPERVRRAAGLGAAVDLMTGAVTGEALASSG
jgi:methanogenic corrinoid protein MtbC1